MNGTIKKALGAEIRKRRKALKMTLEDLALQIGDSNGNLSRMERGDLGITNDKLAAIAKALGVTVSEIYTVAEGGAANVPSGTKQIPFFSGVQFEKNDLGGGNTLIIVDLNLSAAAYAVALDDPAMYAEIRAHDVLIIEPALMPLPSDLFALRSGRTGKCYIRKYRALGVNAQDDLIFEARPIDADYPPMQSECDRLEVLGVVVEHRRTLRKN